MFFRTFFVFSSSRPATFSDTYSGASHFWAGLQVGFWAILTYLGVDCFLLPRLSMVSSGGGKIMGGLELHILSLGKGTLRGTVGEVVVLNRHGWGVLTGFNVGLVRLNLKRGAESSLSSTSMSPITLSLRTGSSRFQNPHSHNPKIISWQGFTSCLPWFRHNLIINLYFFPQGRLGRFHKW